MMLCGLVWFKVLVGYVYYVIHGVFLYSFLFLFNDIIGL